MLFILYFRTWSSFMFLWHFSSFINQFRIFYILITDWFIFLFGYLVYSDCLVLCLSPMLRCKRFIVDVVDQRFKSGMLNWQCPYVLLFRCHAFANLQCLSMFPFKKRNCVSVLRSFAPHAFTCFITTMTSSDFSQLFSLPCVAGTCLRYLVIRKLWDLPGTQSIPWLLALLSNAGGALPFSR